MGLYQRKVQKSYFKILELHLPPYSFRGYGLGLRSMKSMNRSLVAKLGWKIFWNYNKFWVFHLKAKYLLNGDFLQASTPRNSSWIWKGIMDSKPLVESGACLIPSSLFKPQPCLWPQHGRSLNISPRQSSQMPSSPFQTSLVRKLEKIYTSATTSTLYGKMGRLQKPCW